MNEPNRSARRFATLPGVSRHLMIAALVLASANPAMAQEQDPRLAAARERFDAAQAAYDASNYAQALEGFTEVLETMQALGHPNAILVLYNVARSNHRLGQDREALTQYERFLAESAPDAPGREDAARNAAELRRRLDRSGGSSGGGGGGSSGGGGGGGGVSPIGIIIASVGAAAAIVGGVLGGVALSDSDAARQGCVDGRCPSSARDSIAGAQTLANVADGLIFGGLAVAATGVVLMFVLADDGGTEAAAACDPTGCGAVVRGTF